ncbi:cobyrinic acid a,c-diamide synthase [Okeania sp.]|uniref:cobyrinic acid a,c-diamide synthase n=1 Tax=Okeania sp. TaxID=3100323 RepID=UPI002B4B66DF|nr:cobyrinic acid a,c-diamide synthase [Okeania sp.]MEB3339857.1 cobyrinic acid a,c-diamide synthase [Okeania sp.]
MKNQKDKFQETLCESKKEYSILEKLPQEVKQWAASLPWNQRRYVLSFSYILCASSPEKQAEFLDDYIADGLAVKMLQYINTINRINEYLRRFRTKTKINESVLRNYIKLYYIHTAQNASRHTQHYLESAIKLVLNTEERNQVFNYILGFELIKIMFTMSWLQHERLARLQTNQEDFINTYIKPIQHAHQINGIILPKDKGIFFAKRDYYVQIPEISPKKLVELVIATFTPDNVNKCGFIIIRHIKALRFDFDYIFQQQEQTEIFPGEFESILN